MVHVSIVCQSGTEDTPLGACANFFKEFRVTLQTFFLKNLG